MTATDGYTLSDYLLPLVYLLAAGWYVAMWLISLLGWSTARKVYTSRPRSPLSSQHPEAVPGVSIIRPLKGLDPNLYENLESSFLQEYSNFEVILSVQDEHDQALRVVRDLIEKYPAIPVQLITSEEVVGVNPKVNNLVLPFRQAKHDILWVLDSNVHVHPGTLARSVDALTREYPDPSSYPGMARPQFRQRVGVVHHVPFAIYYGSRSTWGSQVESAFLNTNHAKMYIALNRLALDSCVMGKSNMYRKSDIDHLTGLHSSRNQFKRQKMAPNGEAELPQYPPETATGLPAFGEFLAEDNMIAASMWHELGLLHDMSCDVAINAIGEMTLQDYISRRMRWIRVRKHMVLSATLLEPLTECFMVCLIGMFGVATPLGVPKLLFIMGHLAAWLSLDLGVYAALAGHALPSKEYSSFLVAWTLRELLAFPIWLAAVVGSDVIWRGQTYTVLQDGKVRKPNDSTDKGRRRDGGGYELLGPSA